MAEELSAVLVKLASRLEAEWSKLKVAGTAERLVSGTLSLVSPVCSTKLLKGCCVTHSSLDWVRAAEESGVRLHLTLREGFLRAPALLVLPSTRESRELSRE